MSDFAPGDLVVCVDAKSPPRRLYPDEWTAGDMARCSAFLVKGHTYRIKAIVTRHGQLRFYGDPWPLGVFGGFGPQRFRKIDKADEQFTQTVRACKPIKRREPVNA